MKAVCILILLMSSNAFAKRYAKTLFVEGKTSGKWTKFGRGHSGDLQNLLQILSRSQTGRLLIKKAKRKARSYGKTLTDVILPGEGSITDTTLVRRFSISDPSQVAYEMKSKVFINKNLNQSDAVLDLAHELTHFIYRQNFNPYQVNFTLPEFIRDTIEGVGGEVQAFMMECRVLNELFPKRLRARYSCKQIIDPKTGKLSYEVAVRRFYQVGAFFGHFHKKLKKHSLGQEFPEVSKKQATFISSAYGVPYPVAAYEEYVTVMNKVCENDKRRLTYLMKKNKSRSPASAVKKVEKSYLQRCSKY